MFENALLIGTKLFLLPDMVSNIASNAGSSNLRKPTIIDKFHELWLKLIQSKIFHLGNIILFILKKSVNRLIIYVFH